MATHSYSPNESDGSRRQPGIGSGLLMLSLGQLNLFFVIWLTIWPEAFGVPQDVALMMAFSGFFTVASIVGFYLGFETLDRAESTPATH